MLLLVALSDPPSLVSNVRTSSPPPARFTSFSHDKVYLALKTDTMTIALSDNFPPGKTLETTIRTALAEEEELYHILNDRKLARERKQKDTRKSINWLGSARGAAQIVLDSSAEVISVLDSFADDLSSLISIHASDPIFVDLKQSLPSIDAAKRSWESVADVVENLLVQIESLKSVTFSHAECMATELGAHERIEQQSQISVDSLRQSTEALTHSITQKRTILHPIRRVPTEILEQIFEVATLDERLTLQRGIASKSTSYPKKRHFYRTIPHIPTILASTCRRWRTIALSMARLWSFLCVPTSVNYTSAGSRRTLVVGLSTFQQARSCIGTSECELVVGPTNDWEMATKHLCSNPASQISIMNIVLPPDWLDFSEFPPPRVLHIRGGTDFYGNEPPVLPPSISLPASVLARTRELSCCHVVPAVDAPILSVTSFSLRLKRNTYFPDLGLFLGRFPNLTALILSVEFGSPHPQITFTPLHHACVRTLSITHTIIPHLCTSLQRGALSLPSLAHLILLSAGNDTGGWSQLQSLFASVTCFEIRSAAHRNCGSNIRQFLDIMPLLQQLSLFETALYDGLKALLLEPVKQIGKLIVADSGTDGTDVKSYYDALMSGSVDRPDDDPYISIQHYELPEHPSAHRRTTFLVDK